MSSSTLVSVKCVVACRDANGAPALFPCTVEVSGPAYDNGDHYDAATAAAEEAGYECGQGTLVFDENDGPAFLFDALHHQDVAWYFKHTGYLLRGTGYRLVRCVMMRTGPHDDVPEHDVCFINLPTTTEEDWDGVQCVVPVLPDGYVLAVPEPPDA